MALNKITIILCTYNEENYIRNSINLLQKNIEDLELIIVDDNSSDKTRDIINEQNKDKKIKLIHRKKSRGLASAFLTGLMESNGSRIGWIDTNMSELILKFKEMNKALNEDNDIAFLSRYVEGGQDKRKLFRSLCSKYFNTVCRVLLGSKIKDYTSGIFLMKREVLREVTFLAYGHGEFFIEFIENANRKGFKIKEIPCTQMEDDDLNESKTAANPIRFLYLGFIYFIRIFTTLIRRN